MIITKTISNVYYFWLLPKLANNLGSHKKTGICQVMILHARCHPLTKWTALENCRVCTYWLLTQQYLHSSSGDGTIPRTHCVWSSIRFIVKFGCQCDNISNDDSFCSCNSTSPHQYQRSSATFHWYLKHITHYKRSFQHSFIPFCLDHYV